MRCRGPGWLQTADADATFVAGFVSTPDTFEPFTCEAFLVVFPSINAIHIVKEVAKSFASVVGPADLGMIIMC